METVGGEGNHKCLITSAKFYSCMELQKASVALKCAQCGERFRKQHCFRSWKMSSECVWKASFNGPVKCRL